MRVSGVLIALCLCFSSISAHLQASSLRDDSSIYPRETEGASSVTFDGKIYITGGVRREPACATCPPETETVSNKLRIFDIATKSFTSSLGAHMNNERAFHTSVLYKDTIVVFGGASGNQELEQYNITQDQWTVITPYDDGYAWTPTGERPSGRYGHGAAVVGDHLYLFGGFDAVSGNALNDLWTFDFLTKTWESWEVYGWSPNPRGGFSLNAGVVGGVDVLILFGGMDSTKYYNELWIFNTNTHSWKHITPLNGPSPRAFHSAVVFQSSQLVIFGGSSANEEVHGLLDYYNDVWTISVARPQSIRRWSAVKFQESNLLDFPAARDGHVTGAWTSVTGENFFLAFSGSGEQRQTLADIWQFELTIDPLDTGIDGTEITDPQFGPGNLNLNISSARLFRFNRFYGEFTRVSCFPGHFTSECILDCSANANCSGNGQCLFGGSCCCDEGFSGADCSVATCSKYKSFTPHELNIVLLPHAIETAIIKLADLSARLYYLQQTLSAVSHSQVNMSEFAVMTSTFSEYCLTTFVDPEIACFDEIVGCEEPCGDETACWVGDVCINGQCIGGAPVDCSHLANGSNKCVNAWCDQSSGECQVSTVTCDDEDPCTEDMCDPETGACSHHTLSECDDGSCCTYDYCDSSTGKPVCFHTSKCEDYNPCTVDNCCESCSFGTCSYSWQDGCFTSKGQSTDLDPEDPGAPRKNGDAIILSGTKVVGSIPRASIKANAYFWLQSTECQLIYDITYEKEDLGEGVYETGAFFYGVAGPLENAGVIHSLPLGPRKFGYWSYCAEGITVESLRAGKIYVEIYFSTGAIRAQVEFNL